MIRTIRAMLVLLLAVGCSTIEASTPVDDPSAIRAAREVVSYGLKDGPSARWRDEAAFAATARVGGESRTGTAVFGQVNARNGFGAYAGFETYYVGKAPGRDAVVHMGTAAEVACARVGYRRSG